MAGARKTTMGSAAVAAALVALLVAAAASGAAGYIVCGLDADTVVKECRSYCKAGSTDTKPSDPCCAAAAPAVSPDHFDCLCVFRNRLSKDIDGNRAMQIPSKCFSGAPTKCSH